MLQMSPHLDFFFFFVLEGHRSIFVRGGVNEGVPKSLSYDDMMAKQLDLSISIMVPKQLSHEQGTTPTWWYQIDLSYTGLSHGLVISVELFIYIS